MRTYVDLAQLAADFPILTNLVHLNGDGSFKDVYSADHPTDGPVVLKLIDPGQDAESIKREIIAAQQVGNLRVPEVFEVGKVRTPIGDSTWIREKRIVGQSVRALLQQGPFDTTSLLKLGLHGLEALVAAENVHIVHRDVKPDNMMCDTNSDFWLLDFGIARHLKLTSQTATMSAFGKCTPGYAPTEQFRNYKHEIDARSDLFALGVTLYECATGSNPFWEGTRDSMEVLRRTEKMQLPTLNLTFESAKEFGDLVDAMTQKHYRHRPQSAKEALDWMRDIAEKEGI
jgi:serine/threonine-protein kinase